MIYEFLYAVHYLDPIYAPWPVALFMLLAAIYMGVRLWKMLWA